MESPFNSQPHETPPIQERAQFEEERKRVQKHFTEKFDSPLKELDSIHKDLQEALDKGKNLDTQSEKIIWKFNSDEIKDIKRYCMDLESKFQNLKDLFQVALLEKFGTDIINKYIIESLVVEIDAYTDSVQKFIDYYKPMIEHLDADRNSHENTLPSPIISPDLFL